MRTVNPSTTTPASKAAISRAGSHGPAGRTSTSTSTGSGLSGDDPDQLAGYGQARSRPGQEVQYRQSPP